VRTRRATQKKKALTRQRVHFSCCQRGASPGCREKGGKGVFHPKNCSGWEKKGLTALPEEVYLKGISSPYRRKIKQKKNFKKLTAVFTTSQTSKGSTTKRDLRGRHQSGRGKSRASTVDPGGGTSHLPSLAWVNERLGTSWKSPGGKEEGRKGRAGGNAFKGYVPGRG